MREKGNRLVQYVPDYTVFDLETTGISANMDDIIEISAVKVKGGIVQDTFSTLVNPGRHIPAQATKVNGITDQMVSEAPLIREAMTEFLRFVGEDILVGHNIQSFDMKFIYREVEELFQETVSNDFIDTLYMARKCLPELKHHRLTDLAEHFGISSKGAHRALNDCVMNQKCFEGNGKASEKISSVCLPEMWWRDDSKKWKIWGILGMWKFSEVQIYTEYISKILLGVIMKLSAGFS